jgi:isopenicillin-N epimerase
MQNASTSIWSLDSQVYFLNHGSFGATPIAVLEYQQALRERMEKQPVRFLARNLERMLDVVREKLANFLETDAEDLVFIPNATTGINTVLRSLTFASDDEILITNHTYNACRNAAQFVAERAGAKIVLASVPFPIESPQQAIDAVLEKVSPKTKLVLLDHVTSPTALIFPLESLIKQLSDRSIDTLIDGAHAPGFLSLDLRTLGATYYAGNCHKWLCAPKGAAFLYVRKDKQHGIRPLSISHGANSPRKERKRSEAGGLSRFQLEFDWTGTDDPTPYLSIPEAIRVMGSLLPGGWSALRKRNREMALTARNLLCETLNLKIPCPDEMVGAMASISLDKIAFSWEVLQAKLIEEFAIEVPTVPWENDTCLLRISAQFYNRLDQYQYLADTLKKLIC